MIVSGKEIAADILFEIGDALRGHTLAIVADSTSTVTDSYVAIKKRAAARLGVEVRVFAPSEYDDALRCDAVVLQLPIQNLEGLLANLPVEKDVDALNKNQWVRPPVAAAIGEVLARSGVAAQGKKAVVVGLGRLVGAPAKELLEDLGAQVEAVTLEQGSLAALQSADIVVLGAGSPGLVKPEMLKPGVVLIDAGTSDLGGAVVGDADPRCAEVASVFTPTPGGIGPIAVAMLYKNLFTLLKEKSPSR